MKWLCCWRAETVIGLWLTQRMTLVSQGSRPFNHPRVVQDLIRRSERSISLRAAGEIVSETAQGKKRLDRVTVTDTLAFENGALPTATSRGMDSIQEGFWVNNCLSLSATVFTRLFLSLCSIPQNGSLSGNQLPPKSVSLPPLPTPGVFCQSFCQRMLIEAYQSSGPMPNTLWEVPTRKWMTDTERVTALPAILLLWLLVLCICRIDFIYPKKAKPTGPWWAWLYNLSICSRSHWICIMTRMFIRWES